MRKKKKKSPLPKVGEVVEAMPRGRVDYADGVVLAVDPTSREVQVDISGYGVVWLDWED